MRADARLRVGWGQKPDTRLAETTGRVHAGARNGEAGARDGKAGKVSHGDGETHSHGRVVVLGVEAGAEGDVGGVGHEEKRSRHRRCSCTIAGGETATPKAKHVEKVTV